MAGESKTDKAEQRAFSNAVVSVTFAILGTALGAALLYLAAPIFEMLPSWLRYILVASGTVGIVYFFWLLVRLGGAAAGSEHRDWYVDFRNGITSDHAGGHYARGVTRAIAWADRFLGDEGNDDKGIFPRAFGLKEAAPLWTASSYDRSLLLALVYPVLTITILWVIWGHVGSAETVLLIEPRPAWARLLGLIFAATFVYTCFRFSTPSSIRAKFIWGLISFFLLAFSYGNGVGPTILVYFIIVCVIFAVFLAVSLSVISNLFLTGMRFSTVRVAVTHAISDKMNTFRSVSRSGLFAICASISVPMSISILHFSVIRIADVYIYFYDTIPISAMGKFESVTEFLFIVVVIVFVILTSSFINIIAFMINSSKGRNIYGRLLFWGSVFLIIFCMSFLPVYVTRTDESAFEPLIYFFGLLTLVNAPFDWVAIGITRGLIRKGLERSGGWPIILALVDFALSLILLALLAIATLWATDIYNHFLISSGGERVVDVGKHLTALADPTQRGNPEYYWLYAMLFSSQIPAITNMAFGALCLLRGVPQVNGWMAARLPESGGIGSWARQSVASAQALQLALAVAIGCIAYYLMVTFLIGLIDPVFGTGLLEILKAVRITPLFG